jgi:hypothetical protein
MDNIQGMMTLHVECQARRACVGGAQVTTNTYTAACKQLRRLVRCHLLRGEESTKGGREGDGPHDARREPENPPSAPNAPMWPAGHLPLTDCDHDVAQDEQLAQEEAEGVVQRNLRKQKKHRLIRYVRSAIVHCLLILVSLLPACCCAAGPWLPRSATCSAPRCCGRAPADSCVRP